MRIGSTHRREKKVCLHDSRLDSTAQIGRPIDWPSVAKSRRISYLLLSMVRSQLKVAIHNIVHLQIVYFFDILSRLVFKT